MYDMYDLYYDFTMIPLVWCCFSFLTRVGFGSRALSTSACPRPPVAVLGSSDTGLELIAPARPPGLHGACTRTSG